MFRWIARELGPQIPLHFSRFHPLYRLKNLPPTPVATLKTARTIAIKPVCTTFISAISPATTGSILIAPSAEKFSCGGGPTRYWKSI